MRYSEIINELFSAETVPFEWIDKSDRYWRGEFTVNGLEYSMSCQLYDEYVDDSGKRVPVWEVGFSLSNNGLNDRVVGTDGGQFKVFNVVITQLKYFISQVLPECFQITADSDQPNRVKLYAAFVRRFSGIAAQYGYAEVPQMGHEYFRGHVPNAKQWVFKKQHR